MGLVKIAFTTFVIWQSLVIAKYLFLCYQGTMEKLFEWLDSKELV